jgi:hypothetical protein
VAFRGPAAGFGEPGVFEFAAEEVISGDTGEVGFHAEDDQDLEEFAEGGARGSAFDQVKRGPADAGAFGHLLRAQPPPEPGELQVLAESGEKALVFGQKDGFF